MQADNWTSEHCDALRQFLAGGLSFSRIAAAINAKFNTAYSRNATIGRARRMGLTGSDRPAHLLDASPNSQRQRPERHKRATAALERPRPRVVDSKGKGPARLRCVEIDPRHLSFMELDDGDCRYPYGGDAEGDLVTFCGHLQRAGSSYCTAHFHLTLGPGTASERAAVTVALRLVEAA
jgi:GcrA cell cycle regulator